MVMQQKDTLGTTSKGHIGNNKQSFS